MGNIFDRPDEKEKIRRIYKGDPRDAALFAKCPQVAEEYINYVYDNGARATKGICPSNLQQAREKEIICFFSLQIMQ